MRRVGALKVTGWLLLSLLLPGGCDAPPSGAQKPVSPLPLHESLLPMARQIDAAIRQWAERLPVDVSITNVGMAGFHTACEPLSSTLQMALLAGLSQAAKEPTSQAGAIRWLRGDEMQRQATLVLSWASLNDATLQLTAQLWDVRTDTGKEFATLQGALPMAAMPAEARQVCLFKARPLERRVQTGRPLLVRSAPHVEAGLIDNSGEVPSGSSIWLEARLEGSEWRMVRLDEYDPGVNNTRVRRGFVHGPVLPARRVALEVRSAADPSLARVVELKARERLSQAGWNFMTATPQVSQPDLLLRAEVEPGEVRERPVGVYTITVRVVLTATELAGRPLTEQQGVGHKERHYTRAHDTLESREDAARDATDEAVAQLLTAME